VNLNDLARMLWQVYGTRAEAGGQAGTIALGWSRVSPDKLYLAFQKPPSEEDYIAKKEFLRTKFEQQQPQGSLILDSAVDLSTDVNNDERTGFHAEMRVVSAMRANGDLRAGQALIVANAAPCLFCANLLESAAIESGGYANDGVFVTSSNATDRPRTAWWNPFVDKVYGPGHPEWGTDVPGGM
jgi:hypothetical protein